MHIADPLLRDCNTLGIGYLPSDFNCPIEVQKSIFKIILYCKQVPDLVITYRRPTFIVSFRRKLDGFTKRFKRFSKLSL